MCLASPNRDFCDRRFRDSMRGSTKDRQNGVIESVRVSKDILGWRCLAIGKRKEMMTLAIIAP